MNLNKNFLTEVIKYLISKGVTVHDVLDTFNEHFNTLDAFNDSLKNMPTEIKRGTINNVIEEPVLPKYTMTESDKVKLESVSLSPETLNKVFETSKENPAPLKVSLSPNVRDYPTSTIPRGRGVSKARKMLFEVVEGKTVLEHLKANNINYKLFDTRIRKNWTMEKACMTPMTRVISPYTKSKKPKEAKAVIVPDNPDTIICLEPEKITGTKTVTHAKNTTENVTVEPHTKTNTDARVNDANANSDAIRKDKDDNIEKALKKFITSTTGIKYEESKKDKKTKEVKADLTVLEVCQKMNVTTHELREMINTGDFPQPDCDKKWSVKLLKKEGII